MRRTLLSATSMVAALGFGAISAGPYLADSPPSLSVSPAFGKPGDLITVTGSGFPPGEIVGLYFDTPTLFLDVPGPRADSQGNITDKVHVTAVAPGPHSICGDTAYPGSNQPTPAKACSSFRVLGVTSPPSPSPEPSAAAGSSSSPPVPLLLALGILLVVGVGIMLFQRRSG